MTETENSVKPEQAAGPEVFIPCAGMEEVILATQRWVERAVIGLNLCPFAGAVQRRRRIRYAATGAVAADELLAELRRELQWLSQQAPQTVETTLLIHPLAMTDFLDYHFFLGEADSALFRLGFEGVLQIASFHPRYQFADTSPDDVSNYTNRSPYPMLHLLREASVDQAVAAFPDSTQITTRNIDTLRRLGHSGWHRLWTDDAAGG